MSQQSTQHILLDWNFEVQKLTEKYYGSSDYLQDLGGYGFFLCCIIYVLAALLVVIYIVDLVKLIQHKYLEQERSLEIDYLLKKLPYFKKVVEAEIESGFTEELKKDLQDIDKLLDKKKAFFDDSYGLFLLKNIQVREEEKTDSQQMEGGQQKVEKQKVDLSKTDIQKSKKVPKKADKNLDKDLEILKGLEVNYGEKVRQLDEFKQTQMFDGQAVDSLVLSARLKYKFFRIVDLIRRRTSVFGIYTLNDKVELNQLHLIALKHQLQSAIQELSTNMPMDLGEKPKPAPQSPKQQSPKQEKTDNQKLEHHAKVLHKFQKQLKEIDQKIKRIDSSQQDILLMHEDAYQEEQKMIQEIGDVKKKIQGIEDSQGKFEEKLYEYSAVQSRQGFAKTPDDRAGLVLATLGEDDPENEQQTARSQQNPNVIQDGPNQILDFQRQATSRSKQSVASFNNLKFQNQDEEGNKKDENSAFGSINNAQII